MDEHAQWERDAIVLAELGVALFAQDTKLRVSLPSGLANAAKLAWDRDDDGPDDDGLAESSEQRATRHKAATLALIGSCLERPVSVHHDHVVVELDAWFVGDALNAAEDMNLLHPD